jgi:hypothetical protein
MEAQASQNLLVRDSLAFLLAPIRIGVAVRGRSSLHWKMS